jgi:hypothetical protein
MRMRRIASATRGILTLVRAAANNPIFVNFVSFCEDARPSNMERRSPWNEPFPHNDRSFKLEN